MDKTAAEYLSANSFLNAYVRELDDWERQMAPRHWRLAGFPEQALVIPLGHQQIWVGIEHWSVCGRHRFFMPARMVAAQQLNFSELDYLGLSKRLVENASLQTDCSIGSMARFLQRILESHRNMRLTMKNREQDLRQIFKGHLSFIESEQGLLSGHSVHPAPKVRQPMTTAEVDQYGPESGNGFQLVWLSIDKKLIQYRSADANSLEQRIQQLLDADPNWQGFREPLREGHSLLPAHPWQLSFLKRHPQLRSAFANDDIVELGSNGCAWHATSSMRSLYAEAMPYMLKFSMSVRLTNSIRHLQPAEAERGCLISCVMNTPLGQSFARRFNQFTIMQEPAYCCLLSPDGLPVLESMLVFRQNPIHSGIDNGYELLANLCQDHPTKNRSRVAELVAQVARVKRITNAQAAQLWFDGYLKAVVLPLILAQADYGLLFGAHQQNIVLKLKEGVPFHGYFRDCQGTGFSNVGVNLFKLDQQQIHPQQPGQGAENQLQQDMGNKLFAYYLIINSTFSLISALAADGMVEERMLLLQLRSLLLDLYVGKRKDNSFLEYVLNAEQLWQKGNFVCSLTDLNENTLADPLSIYTPIPNPLIGLQKSASNTRRIQHEQSR